MIGEHARRIDFSALIGTAPSGSSGRNCIVTAIAEYNWRRRMAALAEHAGQAESIITPEELQALRRLG